LNLPGCGSQSNGETIHFLMGCKEAEMNMISRLRGLLMGEWQEVVVQGGELGDGLGGTYFLSGLWVHLGSKWIEISALETEQDVFSVSIAHRLRGAEASERIHTAGLMRGLAVC
jgi:hypothetical protein